MGGASVPAGGVNCSLYAAMDLSSSFSVLGNLLRLVRNESSCSPWSFSAPSSEDLAWISNQVDPTRIFMIFMWTIPAAENRGGSCFFLLLLAHILIKTTCPHISPDCVLRTITILIHETVKQTRHTDERNAKQFLSTASDATPPAVLEL